MTKNEQFEKLQLTSMVNPILPTDCPDTFPLHWHQYVEIMALPPHIRTEINPTVTISNTEYVLHPGDITFAWSGELHEIHNNLDKQVIALQFPGTLISGLEEFIPLLNAFRSIHFLSGTAHPETTRKLYSHLQHMMELKNESVPFNSVQILICLYELFIELGNYVHTHRIISNPKRADFSTQSVNKMTQACTYINENCEQILTLDDVAEQFGFSSFYFSRSFKAATGYNFTEYLILQRVKKAQLLLAESDMTITEIGFASGFKSISSFNRAFRQYRGCAPRDYRKYHAVE